MRVIYVRVSLIGKGNSNATLTVYFQYIGRRIVQGPRKIDNWGGGTYSYIRVHSVCAPPPIDLSRFLVSCDISVTPVYIV